MTPPPAVTRVGEGVFRVEIDGRSEIVYVAASGDHRWAFWNGHVFRDSSAADAAAAARSARPRTATAQSLTAPMPATVIKVLVTPGAAVKKGDTVIVLEAMKMELPIRAPADATVTAVHCREGELVQPDATLIELT
jgi:biotin carboxyl carrier protein